MNDTSDGSGKRVVVCVGGDLLGDLLTFTTSEAILYELVVGTIVLSCLCADNVMPVSTAALEFTSMN